MSRVLACPAEDFSAAALRGEEIRIVGFDPGISFGYSQISVCGGEIGLDCSGTWNLAKRNRFCSRGFMLINLDGFAIRFLRDLRDGIPLMVVYETARFVFSVCQSQSSGSITGHLQLICESLNVPFVNMEPGEVKKWATGYGKSTKGQIREHMIERFGTSLTRGRRTEDEFDAIAVAVASARKFGWASER